MGQLFLVSGLSLSPEVCNLRVRKTTRYDFLLNYSDYRNYSIVIVFIEVPGTRNEKLLTKSFQSPYILYDKTSDEKKRRNCCRTLVKGVQQFIRK